MYLIASFLRLLINKLKPLTLLFAIIEYMALIEVFIPPPPTPLVLYAYMSLHLDF